MMSDLSVAILTPSGRGAIGTVLLDGPGALEMLARFFRHPSGAICRKESFSPVRPTFGFLLLDDESREGTVVRYISEERIELHVHGGPCICQAIVRLFTRQGVQERLWSDPRFYSDSVHDQILRLLPEAKTEKTAALILRQADGRLANLLNRLEVQRLRGEDISNDLRLLHAARQLGKHLTQPFRVVLLGPVNAGKSSLINAILGFTRSLVDDSAGTTRDAVTGQTAIDGWPVRFIDTAGLRDTHEEIESQGIAQALATLNHADLTLILFDITSPQNNPFEQIQYVAKNFDRNDLPSNRLIVLNKCDLPRTSWNRYWTSESDETRLFVSAKTGEGLDLLFNVMMKRLLPDGEDFEAIPLDLQQAME